MAKRTAKQHNPKQPKPPVETPSKSGRRRKGCVVCGAEVAPFSTENLCWVCRRLKISAWREVDSQAMLQE